MLVHEILSKFDINNI